MIRPVRDLEPSVPEAVEAAVMHALAREPRFRPASATEFAQELAAASDLPTAPSLGTAITEPLRSRTYQSLPGSSAWFWIAGAAAAAILAAVLGLLRSGGDGKTTTTLPVQVPGPVRGATPGEEARNLSVWLRAHAR